MKVVADRDICIGAGMCVMTTDAVFDQDDEGIVVVLTEQIPADDEMRVPQRSRSLPVRGFEHRSAVTSRGNVRP